MHWCHVKTIFLFHDVPTGHPKQKRKITFENCAIPMFWTQLRPNNSFGLSSGFPDKASEVISVSCASGHRHLALGSHAGAGGLDKMTSRGPLQALGLSKGRQGVSPSFLTALGRAQSGHFIGTRRFLEFPSWALHFSSNLFELPKWKPETIDRKSVV